MTSGGAVPRRRGRAAARGADARPGGVRHRPRVGRRREAGGAGLELRALFRMSELAPRLGVDCTLGGARRTSRSLGSSGSPRSDSRTDPNSLRIWRTRSRPVLGQPRVAEVLGDGSGSYASARARAEQRRWQHDSGRQIPRRTGECYVRTVRPYHRGRMTSSRPTEDPRPERQARREVARARQHRRRQGQVDAPRSAS